LAAEARQISNDLSRAAGLRFDERDLVEQAVADFGMLLEQLRRAKDRLQRVVQLVRDAGHEQADGRQTLLPHHLPLQRLQRLVHLALLLELMIERIARLPQIGSHGDERILQPGELAVRGMPTLTSHGPRSTTAFPKIRVTPSTPVNTCVSGTFGMSRGVWVTIDPMNRSGSRLRASTRLSPSVSVITDPSGSGVLAKIVCSR